MEISRERLSLLKRALKSLPGAREMAETDNDEDSLITLLLLDSFFSYQGPGGLTSHQLLVLRRIVLDGETESEVSVSLGISQQAVSYALTAALSKVYQHLKDPSSLRSQQVFTPEETKKLIVLYNEGYSSKTIAIMLSKKVKSVRNKVRSLREKGVIGVVQKIREN